MKKKFLCWLLALATMTTLFAGCTYKSGPKTLRDEEEKPQQAVTSSRAKVIIEKAINTTDKKGQKFWFNGYIVTKIQKRRNTSMYDGTYVKNEGYLVNARILGQPFKYYRRNNDVYVTEGDNWVKAPATKVPFDAFNGFRAILPFTAKAKQLPDEKILGNDCYHFEINLTGNDVRKITDKINIASNRTPENLLLEQLSMQYWIWVGKKDNYIYQMRSKTLMPVPQAGTMYQEVFFRFWEYNSNSITLTKPENIEKYLKK